MLTSAPLGVVLIGLFGLALLLAAVTRMIVIERQHRVAVLLAGRDTAPELIRSTV